MYKMPSPLTFRDIQWQFKPVTHIEHICIKTSRIAFCRGRCADDAHINRRILGFENFEEEAITQDLTLLQFSCNIKIYLNKIELSS